MHALRERWGLGDHTGPADYLEVLTWLRSMHRGAARAPTRAGRLAAEPLKRARPLVDGMDSVRIARCMATSPLPIRLAGAVLQWLAG